MGSILLTCLHDAMVTLLYHSIAFRLHAITHVLDNQKQHICVLRMLHSSSAAYEKSSEKTQSACFHITCRACLSAAYTYYILALISSVVVILFEITGNSSKGDIFTKIRVFAC